MIPDTFTWYIPRVSPTSYGSFALKHILIVDDESAILEVFRSLFCDDDYQLTFAETAFEAIRVLREETVDLVITDKNLPDASGLDVLKVAKEVRPITEVIIITGYASLETVLSAMEMDAYDYMLKPLNNIFDVKKKVRQALEKQEMTLENQRLLNHLRERTLALETALAELKAVQSELIQSEKLAGIGTLAAGIAHEISSPLFGILGLSEAILDEEDRDLVKGYARDVIEYSKNIKEIVVELSSYSRAAQNEGVTTVDLRRVVEDAIKLVGRSRRVDDFTVKTALADNLALLARTIEVQQALVNLIKNAYEAMDSNPPGRPRVLKITTSREPGAVLIQVSDTGKGIPRNQLDCVFDPFFTTKEVGKGTGLGLNIVYRIVTKYRGTASVESQEGVGTTFTLRFPTQDG